MCSADQKQTPQGCFQPGTHLGFKLIVLALESRDNCVFQVSFFQELPQFMVEMHHPLFSGYDSSPEPEF